MIFSTGTPGSEHSPFLCQSHQRPVSEYKTSVTHYYIYYLIFQVKLTSFGRCPSSTSSFHDRTRNLDEIVGGVERGKDSEQVLLMPRIFCPSLALEVAVLEEEFRRI